MPTQSSGSHELTIIPFAPVPVTVRDDADQLDQAAQSILQLFDSAASVAEEDSQRTLNTAEKLLHHLHAAEDRTAELEVEAATYQQRAERAEQWLHRVYTEVEDRFLRSRNEHRGRNGASIYQQLTIGLRAGIHRFKIRN
jgi:hypothetical protein